MTNAKREMALVTAADGHLFRPVEGRSWVAPGFVEADGPDLRWRLEVATGRFNECQTTPTMLGQFVGLADATDHQIARFVAKYGLLGIDEFTVHGGFGEDGPFEGREPIAGWRDFAAAAGALLDAASLAHLGQTPPESMWDKCARPWQTRPPGPFSMLFAPAHLDEAARVRHRVARVATQWVVSAGVIPAVTWDGATPAIAMGTDSHGAYGLLPALALQLITAISRVPGLYSCSACGRAYTPRRRPRPDRRHYCDAPRCQRAKASHAQWRKRNGLSTPRRSSTGGGK